jgi:ATP-dependent RNA helicase DHX57
MKNIHLSLPPTYKDLWKGEFAEIKKADLADKKEWMYAMDPFQAKKEREDAKAAAEKKREEEARKREKEKSKPGISLPGGGSSTGSHMKGWNKAPKIEVAKKMRHEIEQLIRKDAVWNPHGVKLNPAEASKIVDQVSNLGFRRNHVEEAVEFCKDKEEVLEWLLIHVPEDDLPRWSMPEGYVAGISMASGDLKREATIKRLAAAGFATDLCEDALVAAKEDEGKAAAILQARLLGTDIEDDLSSQLAESGLEDGVEPDAWEDVWEEEQEILSSIYDERYKKTSTHRCSIRLEPPEEPAGNKKVVYTLSVGKPPGLYPNVLPTIALHAEIPAYIRLSATKQALLYAQENFLGEQMIFNIVDWLEREIPNILANPGRLTDVAPAAVAADDTSKLSKRGAGQGRRDRKPKPLNWSPSSPASQKALQDWEAKQSSPAQKKMLAARRSLPAWNLQERIVGAVNGHQVVIISGETGSGKSTQSVQFVLDDMIQRNLGGAANIICTQPRRISALGLADRVADERCSTVGDEVGYSIRGESRQKPGTTKITFCTTGVLLRRLQTSGGRLEDLVAALADVSHVVVDEVHERSLDTDFLLALLRQVLQKRKDLKLILMSATLDADTFENYFKPVGSVGRVEIPGRTHPVDDVYIDSIVQMANFNTPLAQEDLDDADNQKSMGSALRGLGMKINYDLIATTVEYIDSTLGSQPGGVLIFLPGTMEIDRTIQALRVLPNIYALPLHASLLPAEQKRVFPPAPKGMRKVIASTNVAETSITIEDIVAVIDTGRVKETAYDPQSKMVRLQDVWASRAACKQRRGRAGRVRAGTCYKMYTRNAESKMAERPDPEIRRVPLEQLCLSVKAMGIPDVRNFLANALTPPDSVAVEGAVELLRRMGALDVDEMTALGRHLATIPADLRCGKLLVYGATFGCLEPCLTVAAILTVRSPFVAPQAKRDESKAARASFGSGDGDVIADLRAFEKWSSMRAKDTPKGSIRAWCDSNFLSWQTLNDIASNRAQYTSSLKETGFIPVSYPSSSTSSTLNLHSGSISLVRALIAASFHPQTARIEFPETKYMASSSGAVAQDPEARTIKFFSQDHARVFVHPGSTLFDAQTFAGNARYAAYFSLMSTSKVFIRDITPFNPPTLLLFCGEIGLDTLGRGVVVDGWLRLRGWARIGVLVSRLRGMMDAALARKIDEPGMDLAGSEIVGMVRRLVEGEGVLW